MLDDIVTGVEATLLGPLSRAEIDAWVARALLDLTGAEPVRMLFRAGRIDAVYGVEAVGDWATARAAAAWMIAFNARCDLDNRSRGIDDGTALAALRADGAEYFR